MNAERRKSTTISVTVRGNCENMSLIDPIVSEKNQLKLKTLAKNVWAH